MAEPVFLNSTTAHAWNKDRSQLAVANSNLVYIYEAKGDDPKGWKRIYTLEEHVMTVTGIDWNHETNSIATSGQDRNAYVWTLENNDWKPVLVILRIGRAATCIRWSPNGKKFAVGSGSKQIPLCHYEKSQDLWVAKMVKKAGRSTILSVDWSPNNLFLIAGCCDFKCRIFSAYIKDVDDDAKVDEAYSAVFDKDLIPTCGETLAEFDQSRGWVEASRFAPNGLRFAFCGHDSTVHFGDIASGKTDVQSIIRRNLPLRSIVFLTNDLAIGAGYDCVPIVYEYKNGSWQEKGSLDNGESGKNKGPQKKGAFDDAKNMWQQKSSLGKDNAADDVALPFRHQNCINDICVQNETTFSTSGIDGRVLLWDVTKKY